MKKPDITQCSKVIVLCPIGIGNYLMVQPALENLSRVLGKEKLYLLALKPGIETFAKESGLFNSVISWFPDTQSLIEGVKAVAQIRREKFDAVISLFPTGHWKYSVFSLLIGAKIRIGFSYPNSFVSKFVQHYVINSDSELHDVDQNLTLTEDLLGERRYSGLTFPGSDKRLQRSTTLDDNYFVCHPGSSNERGMDKKRFPPDIFADLILKLYHEFGVKCYLAGDGSEAHIRKEIADKAQEAVINIDCKSLSQLNEVLSRSLFYIGNDSGIMHMSVAAGKQCIALFGPTDEKRTGPYYITENREANEHLIIRDQTLECAPCWNFNALGKNKPCKYGDYRCTTAYNPNEQWESIKSFVSRLMVQNRDLH